MFNGPQFNDTVGWESVWGKSGNNRILLPFMDSEFSSHLRGTVKHLRDQAQVITTDKTPRDNMMFPEPEFYFCHNKFSVGLKNLIAQGSVSQFSEGNGNNFFNTVSDAISEYDQHLVHLPEEVLNLYFDYTDLLEAVLLVSKRRPIEIIIIKEILEKLSNIYSKIFQLMVRYSEGNIVPVIEELTQIRDEIEKHNLLPTDAEYDTEISEITACLSDEEKEDLACMFSRRN